MDPKMLLVVGLAALIALVAPVSGASQPPTPKDKSRPPMLVVSNKSADTISFVNLKTVQVEGTAATGRGPHEVAATADGKRAFSANYEGPGDSISVIDVKTMKEVQRIQLAPYKRPHGLAISQDGRKLYVTCEANQAVIEIEVATGKISRALSTGQKITHMLALTPDGNKLYAANIVSGTVTALDLSAGRILAQIPTGRGPEGLEVTPDGKELWVANREEGTLSIIEVAADRVIKTLPCPGFPIRLRFTPDGQMALVSCYQEGSVAAFEVASRREVKRVKPTAFSLGRPIGLLIEPGGKRAFVSDEEGDQVLVIDLHRLEVVDRIPSGGKPDGLALVPARSE
ncbi:MAG: beta-propeller fold lactonase family protein [bacterium]